ncbi:patatin-like phospholipase family protein [Cryobacterium sp. PAMC25264]|uniref:patatin-like phospholipase family protein n=1 Tax=Cryobacterium sp. PAMC25264 TaxID=2861288 RepID=UPI001C63A65A|nr:patatin-like phospholipase family protein [Cryobacterium sp. PAMC25264]QYF72485.1 patatin-like phospholipase family protein [Cryobacterium sp. PAMC25264]
MTNGALVLAGGGSVGIAWELGFLAGLQNADAALMTRIREPETTYVGTSAGSIVAAMLASGASLTDLLQPELDSASTVGSRGRGTLWGIVRVGAAMLRARVGARTPEAGRRRIGAFAARAATGPEDAWVESIAARLPLHTWPDRRLLITAVDVESGEFRVFDRDSGVGLADAVAASCAVPGIFPPVTIQGRRYMDGGMRSIANADLARGCDPVLIVVPMREGGPGIGSISPTELDTLGSSRSHLVYADAQSTRAFGRNPLATSTRAASARAGYRQGQQGRRTVAELWADPRTATVHHES